MGVLSTILQRLRETGTTSVEKLYARILYLFPVRFTVSPIIPLRSIQRKFSSLGVWPIFDVSPQAWRPEATG
jgi:hypothetical protein